MTAPVIHILRTGQPYWLRLVIERTARAYHLYGTYGNLGLDQS